MRSTMTRYSDDSPMRVPVSLTNSALMSCGAPNSFTRSMKAGGKLYSRPQRSPIFIGKPFCHRDTEGTETGTQRTPKLRGSPLCFRSLRSLCLRCEIPDTFHRLANQVLHHSFDVDRNWGV